MTKPDLLRALMATRAETDAYLALLDAAAREAPGAYAGAWSVKDVLSHLTAWEAELVTQLAKARMGKRPAKLDWTEAETDAQNERWFKEYRHRPWDKVEADFQGVRKQLLRQLEAYSEADLDGPVFNLRETWRARIPGWSFEHERAHLAALKER
jgi:uncharacterized damage-inducible protein DinB